MSEDGSASAENRGDFNAFVHFQQLSFSLRPSAGLEESGSPRNDFAAPAALGRDPLLVVHGEKQIIPELT
jgi:hypothetical protein